ncbi:MAG TPA: hypothetical protein PLK05_11760, partial [Steroidobacteraceae bacterium]|nr:hypothetical protein [Steroidobacteraceae bacterium]
MSTPQPPRVAGPETRPWQRLRELTAGATPGAGPGHVRDLFAADPQRFEHCSARTSNLLLDFSRQRVDAEVLATLEALAEAVGLRSAITAICLCKETNTTEKR